jgi:hypothetical protein
VVSCVLYDEVQLVVDVIASVEPDEEDVASGARRRLSARHDSNSEVEVERSESRS